MNNLKKTLILATSAVLLAGCSPTHYLYRSNGDFVMPNGEARAAAIYWGKEEGRLWYGRKYEQTETTVKMRICRVGTGTFAGDESGDPVELQSDENDFRVAKITEGGGMEPLPEPERVPTGSRCGVILVDGQPVVSQALEVGVIPEVAILCRDRIRPGTYPVVDKYRFTPVERREIEETSDRSRQFPDPCPSTP